MITHFLDLFISLVINLLIKLDMHKLMTSDITCFVGIYCKRRYFQAYQLSIFKLRSTCGWQKEHAQYKIHLVNILLEFNLHEFTARENKSASKISTFTVYTGMTIDEDVKNLQVIQQNKKIKIYNNIIYSPGNLHIIGGIGE